MQGKDFDYSPSVEVLQKLIQPATLLDKANLCRAIRMWYTLRQFYAPNPLFSESTLTFASWRDLIFEDAAIAHKRDSKPTHHDPKCLCTKTIPEILFAPSDREEKWQQWKKSCLIQFQQIHNISFIQSFLSELDTIKPFYLTGKALERDFTKLNELGFVKTSLKKKTRTISKVKVLPEIEIAANNGKESPSSLLHNSYDDLKFAFLPDDHGMIAENIARPINQIQRFFLHSNYQTPSQNSIKKIIDVIIRLKEIWKKEQPISVKISYDSASLRKLNEPFNSECITYPVCVYYYQKAFYLCGYGQTPRQKDLGSWYNYRLDRIRSLETFDFPSDSLPQYLENFHHLAKDIDTGSLMQIRIEEIQDELQRAYGFDFYRDMLEMVLCFPNDFDRAYNVDTYRHETFKNCPASVVRKKVQAAQLSAKKTTFLINKINRYAQEGFSFYTLNYRVGDYAVKRRLRDWSYHVEVLLPWELRQELKDEAKLNWRRYQEDI